MAAKEESKSSKIKKKKWYQIYAPKLLKEVLLGETLVFEPELMLNKAITVNLMNIINDARKQNINIKFIVNKIEGNRGLTDVVGYEIIPASLKRLIRKGKKKLDISFVCETSDNKIVRIKPLFLIKNTTKGSTETALRKNAVAFLVKEIKKTRYDDLVTGLISHKVQEALKAALKKYYPLKICEIRYMAIEKAIKPGKGIKLDIEPEEPKEDAEEEYGEEIRDQTEEEPKEETEESSEEDSSEETEESSEEDSSEETEESSKKKKEDEQESDAEDLTE